MQDQTKKIAIIIAFRNFRDEEYFIPKQVFENNGFEAVTASTEKGIAIGGSGGEAEIDIIFEELDVSRFDAVVFVGGPGAYNHIEDEKVHNIARGFLEQGKLVSAICIAPAILAKAGVLSGRKATVWSSPMDKKPVKILEESGAKYEDKPVVADGRIITANGPAAAKAFAEKIIAVLK
jgi:protease I